MAGVGGGWTGLIETKDEEIDIPYKLYTCGGDMTVCWLKRKVGQAGVRGKRGGGRARRQADDGENRNPGQVARLDLMDKENSQAGIP